MKKILLIILGVFSFVNIANTQIVEWPPINIESKPAARWWWMGSAVDRENLTFNLKSYADAGIGMLEITPIYGVKDNEVNELDFLSERWMEMLQHTQNEAQRFGLSIDMNTGTGWPFGGPEVTIKDAASKLLIRKYYLKGGTFFSEQLIPEESEQLAVAKLSRLMAFSHQSKCLDLTNLIVNGRLDWEVPTGEWTLIAAFCGKTLQKVKRAAPGGEGYVMNHLSKNAVSNYLNRFQRAFEQTQTSYPNYFFNDSYEVHKADWTEELFDEFAKRRGYKLEEYLPAFLEEQTSDFGARLVADYRETMAELLLNNFTSQWTDWAHYNGSKTRNQAHGSPGNLIDLYAVVDIPECESFGISNFKIKGLRVDTMTRPNDSDLSMLKYASSGAHITGKPYTSAETFTWLTEHFRTSLSQCKPDLDLMFVSGVNHVFFHGTTYSPQQATWPGWKFYASVDMSPTNSIWRDAPAFFDYITRCQSFLQLGTPDNDFLVYLPVYDLWHNQPGRFLPFDIHKMAQRAPNFINAVHRINNAGYDMDYISDQFIRTLRCDSGKLITSGDASYKALILPNVGIIPSDVFEKIITLADEGATVVFLDNYPKDVPGNYLLEKRRGELQRLLKQVDKPRKGKILFGTDYEKTLSQADVYPELMKSKYGLSSIRRANSHGYHYFIAALTNKDVEGWIPLAVPALSAAFFNPMNGEITKAKIRQCNGKTEVYMQLASGESLILNTFSKIDVQLKAHPYIKSNLITIPLNQKWQMSFVESIPQVGVLPDSVNLGSWTDLEVSHIKETMGSACYSINIHLDSLHATDYLLDLGDVRESARVRVNGQSVGTLWAVPYRINIGSYLHAGDNFLEVEVTNLPANRIADMDRRAVPWRIFKDNNIVNIWYKKNLDYSNWEPMPSGLLGPVYLIPLID